MPVSMTPDSALHSVMHVKPSIYSEMEDDRMIGKKNVVFGFLFLVLTAALGPYMVVKMLPDVGSAAMEKQEHVGKLQQIKTDGFELNMEKLTAEQIAMANTDGILALNKLYNAQQPVNSLKGGPHAHGNLEALLNIVAGIALCFIAVGRVFKQVISWVFIAGTVLHSGMLYLLNFGMGWAAKLLQLGPPLVLLGLVLIGIAAFIGFKGEVVRD